MQKILSPRNRPKAVPASYIVLMRDNQVMLLKRVNTGYEEGKYSLIAGHVDEGETFTQCIIREAKEESGILLKPEDLQAVHIMHRDSGTRENNNRVDIFFITHKWQGKPENKEPHKCDDLSWFDINNLPDNIIPYIRHALDNIKNKIYYSEHGWHEMENLKKKLDEGGGPTVEAAKKDK